MCCSNAAWKREEVPDHKFDFIDVRDFRLNTFMTKLQYVWLYILMIKSFAVYIADVYTAIALLASNRWAASILQSSDANSSSKSSTVLQVPFSIGKWIFTGCIIFSFLLLMWEARKSRAIIKSRDISYAFTNVMSQNWYSLRSYDHFCFFCQINNSKKKKDEFAFFVFFTFKGWKRLILADAPRQVINALALYSFGESEQWTTDMSVYFGGSILRAGVIITMLFTLVSFAGSAILLLVAAIMYVPLLCYIQGNLKEYCCHKIDKRIAELMKRKTRKRVAKEAEIARKEARGDYSHLRDKKTGKLTAAPLPQPTLPKIGLGDKDLYTGSDAGSIRGGSIRGGYQGYPPSSGPPGYPPRQGGYERSNAASALARTAYPYVTSDPDGLARPEYAESVSSLDAFATRGAPMGMGGSEYGGGGGGYSHSHSYSNFSQGQQGPPPPSLTRGATQISMAPSYRSDDEKYYGGSLNEKSGGGYVDEYDGRNRVASPLPYQHQQHQLHKAPSQSFSISSEAYQPPSRQQLYERSASIAPHSLSDTSLGYMQDHQQHETVVRDMPRSYSGWEESERETVAQEYYTTSPEPRRQASNTSNHPSSEFAGYDDRQYGGNHHQAGQGPGFGSHGGGGSGGWR